MQADGRAPPAPSPAQAAVADAARAMDAAAATDPPPALHLLGERFGLSRFERELLFLCAGV